MDFRSRQRSMPSLLTHEKWRQDSYLEFMAKRYAESQGEPPPLSETRGLVQAEVNHGRWIVLCPAECGQAVVASIANPFFICANCGSYENGQRWYHVRFPIEHVLIGEILCKRRDQNRNWKPGETVFDLQNQNAAHGLGDYASPNPRL